jgi:XTP/dITP diphosphohydrolase
MNIRFISSNPYKREEFEQLLSDRGYTIQTSDLKVYELQTDNIDMLVEEKAIKAFQVLGRPLVIEHTGLAIQKIKGLPGGLTQMFWDTLEAERFAELFGTPPGNEAVARTTVAFCDGRSIRKFTGEIYGSIVDKPRGDRHFQWDTVFVPDGETQTFAEIGLRKNEISMRRKAIYQFLDWHEEATK